MTRLTRTEAYPTHSRLTALLGPTNTGKTHRAIQRMLEHRSGMLGLPLRLLAREVYDRLAAELGQGAVALVTGEEKRVGRDARYWICTVEAMPMGREVDFLAVDEIQLAAHSERGHVFTERLTSARGRLETWFLGAATMRPMVRQLLPTAQLEAQPRLSQLRARGQSSVGSLPARSAVVAFNSKDVYQLAELLCRRKGGAAVVHGALSPRARNAQVALYESGEVDFLVATDAIGMGLNLSLRHVAFAGLRKFDGRMERPLDAAELGQIAGRAGRHVEDGSFGTLAPVPPLSHALQFRIEQSQFDPVRKLTWRNDDLCMDSVAALEASLTARSPKAHFCPPNRSSDLLALQALMRDTEVTRRAGRADAIATLWQTCQIPDYDRGLPELHAELVKDVFLQLTGRGESLDDDWLDRRMHHLDETGGDVHALTARVTAARPWTYLCNQPDWLRHPERWRQRAVALERRLSDALHDKLVERFVAIPKTTVSMPASHQPPRRIAADSRFGALLELRQKLAETEPAQREGSAIEALLSAEHHEFQFNELGIIQLASERVGRLVRGADVLRPEIRVELPGIGAGQRLQVAKRLLAWSRDLIDEVVAPLRSASRAQASPAARGLAYQLEQKLGSMATADARAQIRALTSGDRKWLASLGVVVGREVVFLRRALQPRQRRARLAISLAHSSQAPAHVRSLHSRVSFRRPPELDPPWLTRTGFVTMGGLAIRADIAHRVGERLRSARKQRAFRVPQEISQWLGCSRNELHDVLQAFGFRRTSEGRYVRRGNATKSKKPQQSNGNRNL